MTKEFLELLICPSCSQRFAVIETTVGIPDNIEYGIIGCECSVYPIVHGILIHKDDEKTRSILHYVSAGKCWKALKMSFDYRPDLNKILLATAENANIGYRLLGYILCLTTLSKSRTHFPLFRLLDLAGKLRIQVFWTTYLKHRFSATSFWCSLPLLQYIEPQAKHVLDVGCGMGSFSFMMSKRIEEKSIVCQNLEFTGLYLARKYFVPQSNFICSDAGQHQPFPNETFDVVFSCDALQYVSEKENACREIIRMLNPKGLALLAHNHVPGFRDYAAQGSRGDFFDTIAIQQLFERYGAKLMLFDEGSIYEAIFPSIDFPGEKGIMEK